MAKNYEDPNRDIRSHSDPSQSGWDEPIDRYNYVEDVYSDSKSYRSRKGQPHYTQPDPKPPKGKKKMKGWKKALIWIGSILAAILIALLVLVGLLFGRLNVQKVDTDQYVETVDEVAHIDLMDSGSVMNVLVIGADSNQDGTEGRSDTMMLISLNAKTNSMKIVSFLRDLYVQIPGQGKDRLNAAYSYGGAGMLMQTIENNFRIPVDKYLETNFDGFEGIIDAMGGIDVTMTAAEAQFINDWKNVGAVEGENHLNGKNALYFARMRKLDSDFGRTTRQRQVVSAMFKKLKSSNPLTMYKVAFDLMPNLKTNLSYVELIRFGLAFSKMSDAETLSVPSDGTYYDYTTPEGAMVLVPYLEQNIQLLRGFLYE
ncbi:MAG: LCP family protein [Oscillospiraceae bacterium]|nr:LCP family protein [Oscillospiraceae bacterium]